MSSSASSAPAATPPSAATISAHNASLLAAAGDGDVAALQSLLAQRLSFSFASSDVCHCDSAESCTCATRPRLRSPFHFLLLERVVTRAAAGARLPMIRALVAFADEHPDAPDTPHAYSGFDWLLDGVLQGRVPAGARLPLDEERALIHALASSGALQMQGMGSGEAYFTRLSEGQYAMSADRRCALMEQLLSDFPMQLHEWAAAATQAYEDRLGELFHLLADTLATLEVGTRVRAREARDRLGTERAPGGWMVGWMEAGREGRKEKDTDTPVLVPYSRLSIVRFDLLFLLPCAGLCFVEAADVEFSAAQGCVSGRVGRLRPQDGGGKGRVQARDRMRTAAATATAATGAAGGG